MCSGESAGHSRPDFPHRIREAFGGLNRVCRAYDMLKSELEYASQREPEHESLAILAMQGAGDMTLSMIPDRTHCKKIEIQLRRVLHQVADFESGWILAHNHPGRDAFPSERDKETTMVMAFLGDLLERPLVDHWIFGQDVPNGLPFYSFATSDAGRLRPIVTLKPDVVHDTSDFSL